MIAVKDEGHKYELDNVDGGVQTLQFIRKEARTSEGELVTMINGTTNEDVLRVLIDRMQYLQVKAPCRENAIVITKLEESLMWVKLCTAAGRYFRRPAL